MRRELWAKIAGLPEDRIIRIATSDNFWAMGDVGPCGPCSEIFWDHGPAIPGGPPGSPDADGDRFVEIWNLVFMQYEQLGPGERVPLPRAVGRHRHGARTHRRGAAGQARQLRHRPVPQPDRGLGRRLRGGGRRRARGLAPGHRRPSARLGLSDRRRRVAEQGRARLCAAPDHAAGDAPRPYARLQGAADVAAGAGLGTADGRGLSRTGAGAAARHRDAAARRDQFQADPRPRLAAFGRRDGAARARRAVSRRNRVPALRHLWLSARSDRGRAARPGAQGRGRRFRGGDGAPARGGAQELGRLRRGGDRGGVVRAARGDRGDRVSRLRDRNRRRGRARDPARRRARRRGRRPATRWRSSSTRRRFTPSRAGRSAIPASFLRPTAPSSRSSDTVKKAGDLHVHLGTARPTAR